MSPEPEEINYEQPKDPALESYIQRIDRKNSLKNKQKVFKEASEELQSKIRRKDWEEAEKEDEEIEGRKKLKEALSPETTVGEILDSLEDERDL